MENLEPHTHTRLQSPRSIRILNLLPSVKQNAPIQCRLTELNIDNYVSHDYKTPGPYEALSYVWGLVNGSIPIECDGKSLPVTENCHSALVRLRRRFRSRALWIDSICIDQEKSKPSEEERIVQIQLMGEVYRIASCVIVWLGQCSVSKRGILMILQASAILELLSERVPDVPFGRWKSNILWKFGAQVKENTALRQSWIELKNNPWLFRCWTIQEVVFSRKCIVKWGSFSIRWQLLCLGVQAVESHNILTDGINTGSCLAISVRELLRRSVNLKNAKTSLVMRCAQLSQNKLSDSTLPRSTELQHPSRMSADLEMSLISSALEYDATVPHDKIFSMYPLLRYWDLVLPQINYDQPFEVLCEEMTRCWFNSTQNLKIILLAARLPSNESRLPSWVPDWGNRQSAVDYRLTVNKDAVVDPWNVFHKGKRSSRGSSLDSYSKSITGKLHLRGLSLGLISRTLVRDMPDNLSEEQLIPDAFRVFRTWCCAVNDSSFYSTGHESRDALFFTIYGSSPDHYKKEPMFRVISGLLYDLMLYPDCQLLNSAQAQEAYVPFLVVESGDELWRRALSDMAASLSTSLIDNQHPDLDLLFDHPSELSKSRVYRSIIFAVGTFSALLNSLQNNSLFFLDSCYGLAAYTAQEGDEVYLLKGLDVPVVLRPNGENYLFIGPCSYIHGVMEGQKWPEDESELQDLVLV